MRYIFFISLLILMSCGKNRFSLEFDLASDVTDNYNVTYYATDIKGGKTIQAVASIREGKCLLECYTKRPTLAFITPRKSSLPLVVYASRGEKIKISGEGKSPLDWKVEGGKINSQLTDWRIENHNILISENSDSINLVVKEFVESHQNDEISTILILCYFNREQDERGYTDLMASLKGEAKNQHLLDLLGRSDQLFHSYSYPAKFNNMVLRSLSGADTLRINYRDPILLAFWYNGYGNRKNIIDSIKILTKESKDSLITVADICVDADSVSWRNTIRRDSVDKIKRFWVPTGLTDPTLMKLKIPSLPYFIIIDKEGAQSYRGTDLNAAMKDYRRLLHPADSIK